MTINFENGHQVSIVLLCKYNEESIIMIFCDYLSFYESMLFILVMINEPFWNDDTEEQFHWTNLGASPFKGHEIWELLVYYEPKFKLKPQDSILSAPYKVL